MLPKQQRRSKRPISLKIAIGLNVALIFCTILMWTLPLFAADLRVIDGDTIEFRGERIRLLGIDTPETWHPRCAREKAIGLAAKARLVGLLAIGEISIERHGKDRYRRTLAVVRVDGRDAGAALLKEGHALRYAPGREAKAWRMAQWCSRY